MLRVAGLLLIVSLSVAANKLELIKLSMQQDVEILEQQMAGNYVKDSSVLVFKYNNMLRTRNDIHDPVKVMNFVSIVSIYTVIMGHQTPEKFQHFEPALRGLGNDMKNHFRDIYSDLNQNIDEILEKIGSWEADVVDQLKLSIKDERTIRSDIDDLLQKRNFKALSDISFLEISLKNWWSTFDEWSNILSSKVIPVAFSGKDIVLKTARERLKIEKKGSLFLYKWTLIYLKVLARYEDSYSNNSIAQVVLNQNRSNLDFQLDQNGKMLTDPFRGEIELETRTAGFRFQNQEYALNRSLLCDYYEQNVSVVDPPKRFLSSAEIQYACRFRRIYVPIMFYESCVYGDGAIQMKFKTRGPKQCFETLKYVLNHEKMQKIPQLSFSFELHKFTQDEDDFEYRTNDFTCGLGFQTAEIQHPDLYFKPPNRTCVEQPGHVGGQYKDKERFLATLYALSLDPRKFKEHYQNPRTPMPLTLAPVTSDSWIPPHESNYSGSSWTPPKHYDWNPSVFGGVKWIFWVLGGCICLRLLLYFCRKTDSPPSESDTEVK